MRFWKVPLGDNTIRLVPADEQTVNQINQMWYQWYPLEQLSKNKDQEIECPICIRKYDFFRHSLLTAAQKLIIANPDPL